MGVEGKGRVGVERWGLVKRRREGGRGDGGGEGWGEGWGEGKGACVGTRYCVWGMG